MTRWVLLAFVLAALLALVPRWAPPANTMTVDEAAHWIPRSARFRKALLAGRPGDTCIAPHPGVTTMWAGTLGHAAWRATHQGPVPRRTPDAATYWWYGRLGVGLGSALAIALAVSVLLARREPVLAALAGVLLVGDPFFTGHSRILHNDALLASAFLCAVLAGWRASESDRPGRWFALGGAFVAWAALSKLTGVLAIAPLLAPAAARAMGAGTLGERVRAGGLALWRGGRVAVPVAVAVALVTWPALWAAPGCVVARLGDAMDLGGSAHENGNFFLGSPVDDPGFAFYPVAVALRLTPAAFLGVLPGLWMAARGDRLGRVLTGTVLLVGAVLTLQGKKFDRYALPVVPLLDLLAAVGWAGLLQACWAGGDVRRRVLAVVLGLFVALGSLGVLVRASPYELLAYNDLFGGASTARRAVLFGWGEGLEKAGGWLRQVASCRDRVASGYADMLQPYTCQVVGYNGSADQASWIVVYANQRQRDQVEGIRPWVEGQEPVYTAVVAGQEMAWIYAGPVPPHPVAPPVAPEPGLTGSR